MTKDRRLIKLQTAKHPGVITPRNMALYIEENEHLYHDQVVDLEREYSGILVTDVNLQRGLMLNLHKYIRNKGRPPDRMCPSNYPTEEFIPVCLSFHVKALSKIFDKWYFIRRPRIFIVGGRA